MLSKQDNPVSGNANPLRSAVNHRTRSTTEDGMEQIKITLAYLSSCGSKVAYVTDEEPYVLWHASSLPDTTDFRAPQALCHRPRRTSVLNMAWGARGSLFSVTNEGVLTEWDTESNAIVAQIWTGVQTSVYATILSRPDFIILCSQSEVVKCAITAQHLKVEDAKIKSENIWTPILYAAESKIAWISDQRKLLTTSSSLTEATDVLLECTMEGLSSSGDGTYLIVVTPRCLKVYNPVSKAVIALVQASALAAQYTLGDRYIVLTMARQLQILDSAMFGIVHSVDDYDGSPLLVDPRTATLYAIHSTGPFTLTREDVVSIHTLEPQLPSTYILQTTACLEWQVDQCSECQSDSPESCAFVGIRYLPAKPATTPLPVLFYNGRLLPKYRSANQYDMNDVRFMQETIRRQLNALLDEVPKDPVARSRVVKGRKADDQRYLFYCDVCAVCSPHLFWWCKRCAREWCISCHDSALHERIQCQREESNHELELTSRFDLEELCPQLKESNIGAERAISGFLSKPALISGQLAGPITPGSLGDRFAGVKCLATKIRGEVSTTVDKFFSTKNKWLKIKDWPPTRSMDVDLQETFYQSLPRELLAVASPSSPRNLAFYYPLNGIPPDLGPKLYAGKATSTTALHMDRADAINMMFFGQASWHIFAREDVHLLERYLKAKKGTENDQFGPDSPDLSAIMSSSHYLDDGDLASLKKLGITPYHFEQRPGQAVLIPIGYPHQVKDLKDSIKIAVDFISPENADFFSEQANQISMTNRQSWMGSSDKKGAAVEDVIKYRMLLHHAWNKLAKVATEFNSAEGMEEDEEVSKFLMGVVE